MSQCKYARFSQKATFHLKPLTGQTKMINKQFSTQSDNVQQCSPNNKYIQLQHINNTITNNNIKH